MMQMILASTSRYRRMQLEQLGLTFTAYGSGVDEDALKAQYDSIPDLAQALAVEKVQALATTFPDALLIGGDQIAEVEGEMLNKPGTIPKAIEQLSGLAGRAHNLWTAMAVLHPASGRLEVALEKHVLTMRPLQAAQCKSYVETDLPLDCVGSYRVEASGIALFSSIEGSDHTAIVGLPLMRLVTILETFGILIPPTS